MYIRRFKLEEIPKDEEGSAAWLQNLFITKDALLEKFKSTGSFDGVDGCPVHTPVVLPPRHFSLLVAVGVNLAVLYPLCKLIFSFGPWGLAISAVGFAAATAGIKYFLGLTQVAHGTSYGKK
jgi:ABC-type transport system involved in cytochrome c biogenesis permease component